MSPVALDDDAVVERQRDGNVHEVHRAPGGLVVPDDERAVRHHVRGALDHRCGRVARVAAGDDLDQRKRDDARRDVLVRVGRVARRCVLQEPERDLALHAEERHVAHVDRVAALANDRFEDDAVRELAVGQQRDLPARDALAELHDRRFFDRERFVERGGTAGLRQPIQRLPRAAREHEQRGGFVDRGGVHLTDTPPGGSERSNSASVGAHLLGNAPAAWRE